MSSRAPFFEPPLPQPDEPEETRQFANVPWAPPINVVPAVVPIEVDVVATDNVVIRVMDAQAYDRGMSLRIETWVNPDSASRAQDRHGLPEEPQVGLLLDDGTKLGAGDLGHSPDVGPDEPGTADAPLFIPTGGISGELRASQHMWIAPVPAGEAELVVAWSSLDVPETFVSLDLGAVREASGQARELWPLPDVTESEMGWFAYAPGGHTAYTSSLGLSFNDEVDDTLR
ncbi:hypothetical protein ACOCJ7_17550 [Knoellia sp. CPCC 206453]|uniref:hypothetical protein n=1 Tax=Knoellia pratensis TaxID=3404796 RepID=UPI003615D836